MSIKCTEYVVDNGDGIAVDIRVDQGWKRELVFFEIDQDGQVIFVTLECLRDLVMAAEQLMGARK